MLHRSPTLSHLRRAVHGTLTTASPPPEPPVDTAAIANAILNTNSVYRIQTLAAWTPDLVNQILKRLWNHGPTALRFFKSLDRCRRRCSYAHSADSFDHAIDIAARMRDYRTVWALVAQMKNRRLGPSYKTFAIIAERYAAAGKPDRAVRVFMNMHEFGVVQDLNSLNTILDILSKSRRAEMAYELFKMLRSRFGGGDVVSYNVLVNGFCLIKRTPKALEVMKEMVRRGVEPTINTYNTMLKGYFRAEQVKEAWGFFLEMKRRKCEVDAVSFTTLVHGFGVAGEVRRAKKVFDLMVNVGVLPTVATYNAYIQVLCKKDSVENAVVVFEEMVKKGYTPNVVTYNVVIRGLCHAAEMERAVGFMERMKEDECEANVQTYNVVIRYFCEAGEFEKGLEVFERMCEGRCLPNLDTYNVLISAMFVRKKQEDLVLAGKLMVEMIDRGFLPRRFIFNRVLNGLLVTGNQGFAKEIMRMQSSNSQLLRHFRM